MHSIRRGEIYWIGGEVTNSSISTIAHPHVIVQGDVFNQSRIETTIVCALSSNLQKAHEPGNVLLDQGEAQLPRQSVVVVSQILSVPKSSLGEYIGQLCNERIEQILAGLRLLQASHFRGR